MITSNINELLFKSKLIENEKTNKNDDFLKNVQESNNEIKTTRTDAFTYENIKGISLEEIDKIFKDEDKNNMAKNLRLATLFTEDKTLGQVMFNTVMGEPFELGYSYLFDRYEDKHSFFGSKNSSLTDLLHETISNKIDTGEKKPTDVISQDRLDEILTQINSFDFLSSLSNTSKDQYGRYKDEDDDYSFLYNDYALQYQELIYKYEELDNKNRSIISQF